MHEATYAAIRAAQSGDRAALEALTKENTPLIRSIVGRFRGRGAEEEDLFQLGAIGFIKAVRGFDTTRGLALSTYAVPLIMGEIRRYLRDSGTLKVSRSVRELAAKANAAAALLAEKKGEEASLSEIAVYLGVETEALAFALSAVQPPDSLSRPIGEAGEGQLADVVADSEDIAEKAACRVALMQLLSCGNAIEKNVILCRYFKDKTQSETAKLLGISQVQVSRAEKRALLRIRTLWGEQT